MAYYNREQRIRAEASSQAINMTITLAEQCLNITVPRIGTPSENSELMFEIIKSRMR